MKHKTTKIAALLALFMCVSWVALAQQDQRRHRRPPREAMEACRGKTAGAACSFVGPRVGKKLTGTCFTPKADKPLACRPANMPRRGPGRER